MSKTKNPYFYVNRVTCLNGCKNLGIHKHIIANFLSHAGHHLDVIAGNFMVTEYFNITSSGLR